LQLVISESVGDAAVGKRIDRPEAQLREIVRIKAKSSEL
jgi:hypothetical protein